MAIFKNCACFMPLFHRDHKSPESPRIDKCLDSAGFVDKCKFFKPFVMLYDSVTKQARNSYEYSLDSAGFGLSCRNTVLNSL